jgi:hypothetical protein
MASGASHSNNMNRGQAKYETGRVELETAYKLRKEHYYEKALAGIGQAGQCTGSVGTWFGPSIWFVDIVPLKQIPCY